MAYRGNFLILIFFVLITGNAGYAQQLLVRVLLDECLLHATAQWRLSALHDLVLANGKNPKQHIRVSPGVIEIKVTKDGHILVNNQTCKHDELRIAPVKGAISYNGSEYAGSFLLIKKNHSVYLINCVDLEEYLFSVLRTESWPGWPLEVNKAFAIASRSYVIAMVREAKKVQRPYHVKNTNKHQTYRGIHTHNHLRDAVDITKGVFLAYKNEPIIAMFDACCGGVIPARIAHIDFDHSPYLARSYACTYCKSCKIYNWRFAINLAEVEKRLNAKKQAGLKKLRTVQVTKKDKAGIVQQVRLRGQHSSVHLSGREMYSLLQNDIRSLYFSITRKANKLIFNGRGYGHHIGLCQWGSREMVCQGFDYKSILQFYYPGITFMQLT